MAKDGWDKWKDFAHIVSLIATPVVVAIIGLSIQSSIKEREISRDYVQLAAGILGAKDGDKEIRSWAVELLNRNSPVPFGDQLTATLVERGMGPGWVPRSLAPPSEVMELPPELLGRLNEVLAKQEELFARAKNGELSTEELIDKFFDLITDLNLQYHDAASIADQSRLKLKYLQGWARRSMGDIDPK